MISVGVRFNANALSVRMRQRVQRITAEVIKAERLSGEAMVRRAKSLSSGFISTKELRQLGHPYRIGGFPPIDPAIINVQTGALRDHWQYRITNTLASVNITLFNTMPYAKYMVGTTKMIARPILQKVVDTERGPRLERLQAAKAVALSVK